MAATAISLDEYLDTTFRPDCEFIDGEVRKRNVGIAPHSTCLGALLWLLHNQLRPLGFQVLPTLRLRVSKSRVRVPDVCVLQPDAPKEQVPVYPPALVIEILAEEDTLHDTRERLLDYQGMGVTDLWVIDPRSRRAYVCLDGVFQDFAGDTLRIGGTEIPIRLADLWTQLDL